MRVVDTSAWIEGLLGTQVGKNVGIELLANEHWVVPTIIQYELSRWLVRERSDRDAAKAIAYSTQLVVVPLDTDLATKAVDYARKWSLAMADSLIYATAMDRGADLLTCDAHFANLPRVVYLPKTPP